MPPRRTLVIVLATLLVAGNASAGPQRQDIESYRMARSLALRGQLDEALVLLVAELERGFDPAQALADAAWMQARRNARFKRIIRDATVGSVSWIAPHGEPGESFVQIVRLRTDDDTPVADALIYAFQTDASGVYSPGDDDNRNPRLYAFARSDVAGEVRLHTIRPASYPGQSVPQHIHYEIDVPGHPGQTGEILFEGDPLLTDRARRNAERRGWPITEIEGSGADARATVEILVAGSR